ncbi:MAG: hypothetical protein IT378_02615 [Sandaracinaceae bacterium]|nr:hypothetical protein [Sandaracinaceae bacterium]
MRARRRTAQLTLLLLISGCDKAVIEPAGGIEPPGPPSGADNGPSGPELVFALRDIELRQRGGDAWRTIGWDLDGRCTAPPAIDAGPSPDGGPSLAAYDIECVPTNAGDLPPPDGDQCRDNTYGQFISLGLETLPIDVQMQARDGMARGQLSVLVRIRDYDGDDDDPQVTVDVAPTVYGEPAGGTRGDPLAWDGTDVMHPAEGALVTPDEAVIRDPLAHVSGGVLVVHVRDGTDFEFAGNAIVFSARISDGTLTGRLEQGTGRLSDVVLAGRWAVADLLSQLDGLGVCEGTMIRSFVEIGARGAADLLAQPPGTPPAALVPCDAVSIALRMQGYRAVWGSAAPAEGFPQPCPTTP